MVTKLLPLILFTSLITFLPSEHLQAARRSARIKSKVSDSAVTFSCQDSEQTLIANNVTSVRFGRKALYIGYRQVSGNNQNPIMARFDKGVLTWCREDYETSGDDGRGYGILWNGRSQLYVVFSATGTQGDSSLDYRRFTSSGWLTSYGQGGGGRVSVLAQIEPATGEPTRGSFVTAVLSSGNSNTLVPTKLAFRKNKVFFYGDSYYSPRRPDKTAMTCEGSSPFASVFQFSRDLSRVISSSAERCK